MVTTQERQTTSYCDHGLHSTGELLEVSEEAVVKIGVLSCVAHVKKVTWFITHGALVRRRETHWAEDVPARRHVA